jgi:hypothetical protein
MGIGSGTGQNMKYIFGPINTKGSAHEAENVSIIGYFRIKNQDIVWGGPP